MQSQLEQHAIPSPWWGEHHFELQQSLAWQLGSLLLRITRASHEWRLEYHRPRVENNTNMDWQMLTDSAFCMPEPATIERYMFLQTHDKLRLMPRLANRSVVIKPNDPIFIPPSEKAMLYISTPLWLAGFVEQMKEPIFELPIAVPKDTWFGPNPRVGEMCYATQVDGRTDLNLLPPRAFRAVTPVEVSNDSDHQLRFDRMNIPVTALPLFYSDSTQRLWTSHIKVSYSNTERAAKVRIEQGTPNLAGQVQLIHAPRSSAGVLMNIFDSIF